MYREARPPLYDDTLEFLAGSFFGNQEERRRAMLDKIIYAKTMKWHHEGEYRLVIAVAQGEKEWCTLPYHPDEITELHLGRAMTDAGKDDIVAKAKALNPNISIFKRERDGPETKAP